MAYVSGFLIICFSLWMGYVFIQKTMGDDSSKTFQDSWNESKKKDK